MKKSWQEKLKDAKDLPKVVHLSENGRMHWRGSTMAIPSPVEVDEIMAGVPRGKLITIDLIRQAVARKHSADIGCPLTSGIFSWIAANAAEEVRGEGGKQVTPWWRTLKSDGSLNPKFPGGSERQAELLRQEGFEIVQKGRKLSVVEFEKALVKV